MDARQRVLASSIMASRRRCGLKWVSRVFRVLLPGVWSADHLLDHGKCAHLMEYSIQFPSMHHAPDLEVRGAMSDRKGSSVGGVRTD